MPKQFIFKTSLPGIEVENATPDQCSIHSSYGNQKTKIGKDPEHFGVETYTFSSNPADGTTTNILTIPHGYDYVPSCRAFCYAVTPNTGWDAEYYIELPFYNTTAGYAPQRFVCYCDEDNFKIDFIVDDPSALRDDMLLTSWTFKYYIFAENGVAE